MTNTDQQTHTDEQALASQAAEGDRAAFDELSRRHTTAAWNLAHAVTLQADDAVAALEAGVGQTFTAQRAGRLEATVPFRTHLLAHVHAAAMDQVRARTEDVPAPATATDPHLAEAFAGLPVRWRGALWLHAVDDADDATVAAVAALPADDVAPLLARARNGLVERYLRTPALGEPARNCRRAIARLGGHVAGSLPAGDREKLERHLSLCESCTAAHARLATLDAALPLLAVAVPDRARHRVAAAWTAAAATGTTRSGMSERTEKLLAGVSAFAAAVGVIGAALFAVADDDEASPTAAAPLAPLVDRVATPRPFDLTGDVAVPASSRRDVGAGITSGAVQVAADSASPQPASAAPSTDPTLAATGPDSADDPVAQAPTSPIGDVLDESPVPVPDEVLPEAEVSLEVADQPVEADVDEDPNLTVGPVSTGSDDGGDSGDGSTDEDTVEVGGSLEPAQPVADAVNDGADTLGL